MYAPDYDQYRKQVCIVCGMCTLIFTMYDQVESFWTAVFVFILFRTATVEGTVVE